MSALPVEPKGPPSRPAGLHAPLVIAHLLQIYELGGAEQLAFDLATWQRKQGHRVLVVATEGTGPRAAHFEAAGIPACTIKKGRGLDPTLTPRLAAHFLRQRVDLVHTHTQQPLIFGALAARLAFAPVIHTMHGLEPGEGRRALLRRAAARLTDAFVTVSTSLHAHVQRTREAPRDRLHLIENGIDLSRFALSPADRAARRAELRAELALPADTWIACTVARLVPVKNQALLLRALAPLLDERARLLVAGEGPEEPALRALADRLGVASRVLFLGGRSDIPRVLAAADAFALSSHSEGLPLALIEAMAMGLPAVSTAVGSVADLIVDGVSGWMTPPGELLPLRERLASLRADRPRAEAMGRRARELAFARRGLDRMAEAYMALYAGALQRSPPRSFSRSRHL
jgi:glycosyltransferase involved in cell wall biosynthesis